MLPITENDELFVLPATQDFNTPMEEFPAEDTSSCIVDSPLESLSKIPVSGALIPDNVFHANTFKFALHCVNSRRCSRGMCSSWFNSIPWGYTGRSHKVMFKVYLFSSCCPTCKTSSHHDVLQVQASFEPRPEVQERTSANRLRCWTSSFGKRAQHHNCGFWYYILDRISKYWADIGHPGIPRGSLCFSSSSDDAERIVLFWQADFHIRVFQVTVALWSPSNSYTASLRACIKLRRSMISPKIWKDLKRIKIPLLITPGSCLLLSLLAFGRGNMATRISWSQEYVLSKPFWPNNCASVHTVPASFLNPLSKSSYCSMLALHCCFLTRVWTANLSPGTGNLWQWRRSSRVNLPFVVILAGLFCYSDHLELARHPCGMRSNTLKTFSVSLILIPHVCILSSKALAQKLTIQFSDRYAVSQLIYDASLLPHCESCATGTPNLVWSR